MFKNISGVILAGGASSRFNGLTKANIVVCGKTIISRISDTLKDIFEELIIVTNAPDKFKEYSEFRIICDQFTKTGPLGGIHAALKASSNRAIFVFAGDMPFPDRKIIISQIKLYKSHECDILIPQIGQSIEPLHSIYCTSILRTLEEYLTCENDFAVREFIKLVDVRYFQLKDTDKNKKAFININSPEDILNFEKAKFFNPKVR